MSADYPEQELLDSLTTFSRKTPSSKGKFVFIVESDFEVGTLICQCLQLQGYQIRWLRDPQEVLPEASINAPVLFLLDVVQHAERSFELCRQIRRSRVLTGSRVIFFIADKSDGVTALESGGDAYVTKPVNFRELTTRIKSVLREPKAREPQKASHFGALAIDPLSMTVRVNGHIVPTTIKEFHLLHHFAHHPSRVFTRGQLLEAVWAEGAFVTQRSVDVYIRRLREKIEPDPANPIYLISVRGVGYRFDIPRDVTVNL